VKTTRDFVAMGMTQNDFAVSRVKRLGNDVEVNACVQYERWKVPYVLNSDTSAEEHRHAVQLYPRNGTRRY
jgi:hypothetical protein